MTDVTVTIRGIPEEAIAAIDAMLNGKSREAYLRELIVSASQSPEPVKLRWNQGLKAIAPDGSNAVLRYLETSISGGANNLTQAQFDAYQKAKLIADPRNGNDWTKAKQILEDAGFEVYWV